MVGKQIQMDLLPLRWCCGNWWCSSCRKEENLPQQRQIQVSNVQNVVAFHSASWWIGFLTMAYYNPYTTGYCNRPQYKATHPGFLNTTQVGKGSSLFVFSIFFNFAVCFFSWKKKLHPWKLTCPKTMVYFSREYIWTNHWFSGDMLVFRGATPKSSWDTNHRNRQPFQAKTAKQMLLITLLGKKLPYHRWKIKQGTHDVGINLGGFDFTKKRSRFGFLFKNQQNDEAKNSLKGPLW